MEQWTSSSTQESTARVQEEGCGVGHRESLMLSTSVGGRICLVCLATLISDRNPLLIHRAFAVQELAAALKDQIFLTELLKRYPKFLVAVLSDAIGSSSDGTFSKSIMNVILSLCSAAKEADGALPQEFMRRIARQLGSPSLWNPSKRYTLHLMGLLLELHCQEDFHVPQAVRCQKDLIPNLISGLQLTGEQLQGEILFVLYKLSSLEGGVDELLNHVPQLCYAAVFALLKTESDELRINCIALLSEMAGKALFDIRLDCPDTDIVGRDGELLPNNITSNNAGDRCFANTFAEAIKGCLLASDVQAQSSALKLISLVFPDLGGERYDNELRIFVEEEIVEYVLEIIRLTDGAESLQALAVDVLYLLSAEKILFPQRFKYGLETMIRALAKSVNTPSTISQTKILNLLSQCLPDLPGILPIPHVHDLMLLLKNILQHHANLIEDQASIGHKSQLPWTFHCACLALISLTESQFCECVPSVSDILQTATTYAILATTPKGNLHVDLCGLRYSVSLLNVVYQFHQTQSPEEGTGQKSREALLELCELHVLPAFTDNLANVDDVLLACTVLQTFTLLLEGEATDNKGHDLALRMAENRCFSLPFELMARFPDQPFKEIAYQYLGAIVGKLGGRPRTGDLESALPDLPTDPSDLLQILEQSNTGNQQLLSAHHAIVAVFSTSYTFDDRLAKETDVIASLEQHLLVNHGSALVDHEAQPILKQFVSLYASIKETLKNWTAPWSAPAETILEMILEQCSSGYHVIGFETPKPVLRWFLNKQSLKVFNMRQILQWITGVENYHLESSQVMSSGVTSPVCEDNLRSQNLDMLAELIGDENCGTSVLISLLEDVIMQTTADGVRIVTKTLTKLARLNVFVGRHLLQQGLLSAVPHLIRNYASKAMDWVLTPCLELLFQLLYDSDHPLDLMNEKSWIDITTLCAKCVTGKKTSANAFEDLPFLSFASLILHKSYESDCYTQVCERLVCDQEISARLETLILDASRDCKKLSQNDLASAEGEALCAAMIFNLLKLKWIEKTLNHFGSAIRFRDRVNPSNYDLHYIGLPSSIHVNEGPTLLRTSITCEHWSTILYFGTPTLRTLASCCLQAIFSQFPPVATTEEVSREEKELQLTLNFFKALTMVLQGSVLGDLDQIRRNASWCLGRLLSTPALSMQQKNIIASSPWNHLLLESLLLSLSTPNLKKETGSRGLHDDSGAYFAAELLKFPVAVSCSTVFQESVITQIISQISDDDISPTIVHLFHELLLAKYLTSDHVRSLRDLFQASRRKAYDQGLSSYAEHNQIPSTQLSSKIMGSGWSGQSIIHSAILDLAITSNGEAPDNELGSIVNMVDIFVHDSSLQFD